MVLAVRPPSSMVVAVDRSRGEHHVHDAPFRPRSMRQAVLLTLLLEPQLAVLASLGLEVPLLPSQLEPQLLLLVEPPLPLLLGLLLLHQA